MIKLKDIKDAINERYTVFYDPDIEHEIPLSISTILSLDPEVEVIRFGSSGFGYMYLDLKLSPAFYLDNPTLYNAKILAVNIT